MYIGLQDAVTQDATKPEVSVKTLCKKTGIKTVGVHV